MIHKADILDIGASGKEPCIQNAQKTEDDLSQNDEKSGTLQQ